MYVHECKYEKKQGKTFNLSIKADQKKFTDCIDKIFLLFGKTFLAKIEYQAAIFQIKVLGNEDVVEHSSKKRNNLSATHIRLESLAP